MLVSVRRISGCRECRRSLFNRNIEEQNEDAETPARFPGRVEGT